MIVLAHVTALTPAVAPRRQLLRQAGIATLLGTAPVNANMLNDDPRNDEFLTTYPKALAFESGIALVILILSYAGIGPLAEKFARNRKD